MKSLIVLIIDHDDFEAEAPSGNPLSPEELKRQGHYVSLVSQDFAGMYGYEGWNTVFEASDGLLALIADASSAIDNNDA